MLKNGGDLLNPFNASKMKEYFVRKMDFLTGLNGASSCCLLVILSENKFDIILIENIAFNYLLITFH
jgi:hypothetical protein